MRANHHSQHLQKLKKLKYNFFKKESYMSHRTDFYTCDGPGSTRSDDSQQQHGPIYAI